MSRPRRLVDHRTRWVPADPATVYRVFSGIGGRRGWLYADWLWRVRGRVDRLIGGVGLSRGRRDPDTLVPGDVLDCWRVAQVEPGRLLRLRAEMKLPGTGWLEFRADPAPGGTLLSQTATFHPHGLAGLLYWYALAPIHPLLFRGLIAALAARAVRAAASAPRKANSAPVEKSRAR